jgi:site-specific recombinase XerD
VSPGRLRVVAGARASGVDEEIDPAAFEAACIEGWALAMTARGLSQSYVDTSVGLLERFLARAGMAPWDLSQGDVDRVIGELALAGAAPSTRRGYAQALRGFVGFLSDRKASEIEARFGVHVASPLDRHNAARHVGNDSPATLAPPGEIRLAAFFDFLRERVATARKYRTAARDYALFRTLYLAGLRAEEAALLELQDLHFDRGPFGKLHVRFGKGTKGSGPRPRWVPMLDQLDQVLRWYADDVRGLLPDGRPLFCTEGGGVMHAGSIRNQLAHLLDLEGRPPEEGFSPHDLRRACATHNYERGVDLVAIQQLLGHWHVGTTMRYVTPSASFIEDAYRKAISKTLTGLDLEERR